MKTWLNWYLANYAKYSHQKIHFLHGKCRKSARTIGRYVKNVRRWYNTPYVKYVCKITEPLVLQLYRTSTQRHFFCVLRIVHKELPEDVLHYDHMHRAQVWKKNYHEISLRSAHALTFNFFFAGTRATIGSPEANGAAKQQEQALIRAASQKINKENIKTSSKYSIFLKQRPWFEVTQVKSSLQRAAQRLHVTCQTERNAVPTHCDKW